jgi:hypothetical protein
MHALQFLIISILIHMQPMKVKIKICDRNTEERTPANVDASSIDGSTISPFCLCFPGLLVLPTAATVPFRVSPPRKLQFRLTTKVRHDGSDALDKIVEFQNFKIFHRPEIISVFVGFSCFRHLVVFRATRPSPSSEMEIDGTTLNHP